MDRPSFPPAAPARNVRGAGHVGHAHFWERMLTRRQLVRGALGGTALGASGSLLLPASAGAHQPVPATADAGPIPGGLVIGGQTFHVQFPYFGNEVSTITDFNGLVAAAEMQGSGTATNTSTGATSRLIYDADMRVMQGSYIGLDGAQHSGTFGFI